MPYIEFLSLQRRATAVVTDSGGIQEETTYLNVPCLTLRNNTERPVTVTMGTNILVGQDGGTLRAELTKILAGKPKQGTVPPLWDGHAGQRIAEITTLITSCPDLVIPKGGFTREESAGSTSRFLAVKPRNDGGAVCLSVQSGRRRRTVPGSRYTPFR